MEYNEKQQQILEVAEKLVAINGFDGASVRDIAKDADVNVAMISYYFGSKEKLLQAIFEKRTEMVKLQLESLLENKNMRPLDKVFSLIDSFIDKILSQQDFHKLMVCLQATDKDEVISGAIREMKIRNHGLIKKLVQEGQKSGDFKKNIDVPMMMATLIGTSNQLVTNQKFHKEINNLGDMPEEEYQKYLRKKLSLHLKSLFKATLTNE
jgi:AcrR family transcriptional regulator